MRRIYNPRSLNNAKTLRSKQTEAESILWANLRNRSLAGIKFRRQVPIGEYITDFLAMDKKLIVEIDGSQHLEMPNVQYDFKRTKYLQAKGYTVIRVYNNDIFNNLNTVLEFIYEKYTQL